MASGLRKRTLVRSCTRTRGSPRSAQASWPYPTSTATTSAAPRRSSTSVKPPVDAPASRQRRPCTVTSPKASRAPISLCAPREAHLGSSSMSRISRAAAGSTAVAGLVATCPAISTRPAAISSAASDRDRAWPRRTSSASSRLLRTRPSGYRSILRRPGGVGGARQRLDQRFVDAVELGHLVVDGPPIKAGQVGLGLLEQAVHLGRQRAGCTVRAGGRLAHRGPPAGRSRSSGSTLARRSCPAVLSPANPRTSADPTRPAEPVFHTW